MSRKGNKTVSKNAAHEKRKETTSERVYRISNLPEVKILLELEKLVCLETYEHSYSVAGLTANIIERLPYTNEEKDEIIKGALLHDIGKVFLPFNLTQLPRALSKEEYDIVKTHTALSYEIVKPVFSKTVQNICLYHHERPNGTGYMNNKPLSGIPNEALIVQVADIFDALTRERSYKQKFEPEAAIQEMKKEVMKFGIDDGYFKILEDNIIIKHM